MSLDTSGQIKASLSQNEQISGFLVGAMNTYVEKAVEICPLEMDVPNALGRRCKDRCGDAVDLAQRIPNRHRRTNKNANHQRCANHMNKEALWVG